MEKPAVTTIDIHPLLKRRWSPRSFTDQMIDNETLKRIFEAARWSPSSSNEQPWRFVIGKKGSPTWDSIFDTLVDFNQKWARLAPVLGISIGKTISSKSGKPSKIYKYDVGQSLAHITFQAMNEGIFVHQMGGFDPAKAASLLKVPEGFEPVTSFAMGYKGDPTLLESNFEEMEKAERSRISLEEMVFDDSFGHPPQWA